MKTVTVKEERLRVGNLLAQPIVVIPLGVATAEALRLLQQARVSEGVVVDRDGQCVGVFSPTTLSRNPKVTTSVISGCAYQTQGYLLTGQRAVICTLSPGICPLQMTCPMTAGRHAALCLLQPPPCAQEFAGESEEKQDYLRSPVENHLRTEVLAVASDISVLELAQQLLDFPADWVLILEDRVPVGLFSIPDLLSVLSEQAPTCGANLL